MTQEKHESTTTIGTNDEIKKYLREDVGWPELSISDAAEVVLLIEGDDQVFIEIMTKDFKRLDLVIL